jgi:hypothetical protein
VKTSSGLLSVKNSLVLFLDGQRLRNYYSRLFDMLMHKFLKVPKCEILTSNFYTYTFYLGSLFRD